MNGQLFLLLLSMLFQNPNGEILPDLNRNVGYASDPSDGNKFCLIVQIPPDKMGEFARGPVGQEMEVAVPDEIRNVRIEKVIFRIGTGPIERILPIPTTLSDSRTFTNPPQVVDLNNRSTVPIDQPRPPTNLTTVAQNGPGFATNTTSGNNGNLPSFNNDGGTYPPFVSNGLNDRSLSSQANGSRPVVMPFNQNPTQARDGFSGAKSSFNNLLVPSQTNATNPIYASSNDPYAAGNNTTPNALGTNSNRQYNMASNSTNPPAYYDSQFSQQNSQQLGQQLGSQSGYASPPSLAQTQLYGQSVQQQQPNYVSQNPYAAPQMNAYSQVPIPFQKPNYPPLLADQTEESQPATNKLLPFLLLFSIVVNVYLGIWMSRQKSVYRQKLGNLRGIPASDLA